MSHKRFQARRFEEYIDDKPGPGAYDVQQKWVKKSGSAPAGTFVDLRSHSHSIQRSVAGQSAVVGASGNSTVHSSTSAELWIRRWSLYVITLCSAEIKLMSHVAVIVNIRMQWIHVSVFSFCCMGVMFVY